MAVKQLLKKGVLYNLLHIAQQTITANSAWNEEKQELFRT